MSNPGIALVDDYARLGLLEPTAPAPETAQPAKSRNAKAPTSGPGLGPASASTADQFLSVKAPELVQVVEFPHPLNPSRTQILTLDRYEKDVKDDDDEFKDATIVIRRNLNGKGKTTNIQVEIQSKMLQRAIKKAASAIDYDDLNLSATPLTISRPFRCLFFLKGPLKERADSPATKTRLRDEINLLLEFIDSPDCLGPLIAKYDKLVPNNKATFDILWMLFPPFELVYVTMTDFDECFLVQRCFNSFTLGEGRTLGFSLVYACHDGKKFGLKDSNLAIPKFSGTIEIDTHSMPLIPLRFLEESRRERIKKDFTSRAKEYLALQKAPFTMKQHCGSLWILSGSFLELAMEVDSKDKQIESNGRVVIDATAAREILPNASKNFIASSLKELLGRSTKKSPKEKETAKRKPKDRDGEMGSDDDDDDDDHEEDGRSDADESMSSEASDDDDVLSLSSSSTYSGPRMGPRRSMPPPPPPPMARPPLMQPPPHSILPDVLKLANEDEEEKEGDEELSDLEYIICQSSLLAFMLDRKAWVKVLVEDLRDIDWYPDPWDTLQLEPETKSLIKTLVESFAPTEDVFSGWDDIVEGKGKGLIFLLHGLPGLGKTFTAETLAEQTRRPLYQVSTGELSINVTQLERQLRDIFRLGWRWGAIVLIDEADVIMAERDLSDLARSAIVAVFLRLVEYYRGLLFLTTNKIEDFDPAFYNRIHAIIEYPQLDKDARIKIWKNLLHDRKRGTMQLDASWDDQRSKIYDLLGDLQMNGRDIRNLIRAAYGVALSKKGPLGVRHITRVLTRLCRVPNGDEIARRLEFAARKTDTFTSEAQLTGEAATVD